MSNEYEITDGKKTMVVGLKAIEGGILTRGFRLKDEELEAKIRSTEPYLLPSNDGASTELEGNAVHEESKVPVKEPAKNVNDVVKQPKVDAPKPDFEHALTLSEADLDKYAATFGCNLDGRKSLTDLRTEFAAFCGVEWSEEPTTSNTDLPADLECPHCGTKARTEKSYMKNHGDKCYKALKVK